MLRNIKESQTDSDSWSSLHKDEICCLEVNWVKRALFEHKYVRLLTHGSMTKVTAVNNWTQNEWQQQKLYRAIVLTYLEQKHQGSS